MSTLPTYYLPHGGGPWTAMPERANDYAELRPFLEGLLDDVGTRPRAILIVSGHWEAPTPTLSARSDYAMLYDYYGFPQHTYELQYPAPGSPPVAARAAQLLRHAGFPVALDTERGYDHGVFVPLMLVAPHADIPVVPLSLVAGLDPARHLALGAALAPLRAEGVLLVGSGMSFHNLRAQFGGADLSPAARFDAWLDTAVTGDPELREPQLAAWGTHPRRASRIRAKSICCR